ncbi:MAG: Obg family GTPase CgtA, partial [Solirubrobacterales bacterium]
MFQDRAKIYVQAGGGGNGEMSFRREAHVPRGGPDGGDGGRGGDVVLECSSSKRDLSHLRRTVHHRAERGAHGQGSQKHGARGDDALILVPAGTQATSVEGVAADLTVPGQQVVVARGGSGGRGNQRFTTSTRQAPRFAERGLGGQEGWIELHLKLLADAGLIGKPNAGKSSLLGRLTRAAPKVGAYPFTTIEPVLGTLDSGGGQLVLADIPGLIEGAADGAGLGHEFLAHVERCRLLAHVIELEPTEGTPADNHAAIRAELAAYGAGLEQLPELIVLSKRDLVPDDAWLAELAAWRERHAPTPVVAVSAATGAGLEDLRAALLERWSAEEAERPGPVSAPGDDPAAEFTVEHRVYRPPPTSGFAVSEEEEGAWRIAGTGIPALV